MKFVTFKDGESLCDEPVTINSEEKLLGFFMPPNWTAAPLTFRISNDGLTYYDLYDRDGTEIVITSGAGHYVAVNSAMLALDSNFGALPNGFIQFRSGTAAEPVAQTSTKTIGLHFA